MVYNSNCCTEAAEPTQIENRTPVVYGVLTSYVYYLVLHLTSTEL